MPSLRNVPPEKAFEQIFDLSYVMVDLGCSADDVEKGIGLILQLLTGEKTRAELRCRNGVKVVLRKKRFGIDVSVA